MYRDCATQTDSPSVTSTETQTETAVPTTPCIKDITTDHSYIMTSTPTDNIIDNQQINISDIHPSSCIKQLYMHPIKPLSDEICDLESEICLSDRASSNSSSEDSSLGHDDNEKTDPSYMPCASSSSDDSSVDIDGDSITDKSFIVHGSALETLFGNIYCNVCGLKAISTDIFTRGTL